MTQQLRSIPGRCSRPILAVLLLLLTFGARADTPPANTEADAPAYSPVQVYKSPSCGCCGKWVDHLRDAGLSVDVINDNDMRSRKIDLGVPASLASCHTATVDGYVIEGHVPATDIKRLLSQRPATRGLAVPGMPVGSPGMEMGDRRDPYTVWMFDARGKTGAYAQHNTPSASRN